MKQHRYRITVEHLADANGNPCNDPPLQFQAGNHDEVLGIVERIRQRGDFDADTSAAFAVGLKLFGEVMLENRAHPLFAEFAPHFRAFMQRLKGRSPGRSEAQA